MFHIYNEKDNKNNHKIRIHNLYIYKLVMTTPQTINKQNKYAKIKIKTSNQNKP